MVLDALAKSCEAQLAVIASFHGGHLNRLVGNPEGVAMVNACYEQYERMPVKPPPRNIRALRLFERRHFGFVAEPDFLPEAEALEDFELRTFVIPQGRYPGVATFIDGFVDHNVLVSVEGFEDPAHCYRLVSPLDVLRPHLCRAAALSTRLQMERAGGMTEALERIGLSAAVVTRSGKALSVNAGFNARMGPYLDDVQGRVRLRDAEMDGVFRTNLTALLDHSPRAKSVPLLSDKDERPLIMHLFPVTGDVRDLFASDTVLIVIAGEAREQLTAPLVQQLFDLTPAEAGLALRIAGGDSLEEIAVESGRSIHTVRNQTKSILMKTGIQSQKKLVSVLRDLSI